jgi:hypothetical protein
MTGWRDKSFRRLGAALAGLALAVQLAFASWGMPALATPGDPADAFGPHALCLAGDPGKAAPETPPARPAPAAPAHDHGAFCCLWHPLPGVAPMAAAAPLPVAYAAITRGDLADSRFLPGLRHRPANARAPPTLT